MRRAKTAEVLIVAANAESLAGSSGIESVFRLNTDGFDYWKDVDIPQTACLLVASIVSFPVVYFLTFFV
jgi:hypothetical protein